MSQYESNSVQIQTILSSFMTENKHGGPTFHDYFIIQTY